MMADFIRKYIIDDGRDDHDHDHEHENENEGSSAETITAKSVAMVCLFLASFIIGLLPIKLSKWFNWETNNRSKDIVSLLLCFGGGVLLCTTFLHLLPEIGENIDDLVARDLFPETRFHFPELLMCIGFFTMYLVEECVHFYLHRTAKKNEVATLKRTLSIRKGEITNGDSSTETSTNSSSSLVKIDEEHGAHIHSHAGHSHIIIEEENSIVKSIRGLLVVLALSVHELFEGLAVGLESSASTVWYMFGAVSAHKCVIAFCVGIELVTTKTKTLLTVIYVFTFAVVSPLGIGIGILVTADGQDSTTLASVILQGLASGTLLYVVFFEILQKHQNGGLKRYFALFCGFALMFGVTLLTGHEHSHGGGGGHGEEEHHHDEEHSEKLVLFH